MHIQLYERNRFIFCRSRLAFFFQVNQQFAQAGSGTVQAGFEGANRAVKNHLHLFQCIALDVVQPKDMPMIFAQSVDHPQQVPCQDALLRFQLRVTIHPGEIIDQIGAVGIGPMIDSEVYRGAGIAAVIVDEDTVHDTAQPRAKPVDFHELMAARIQLQQQLLNQVLRVFPAPCKAVGEPEKRFEMGADQGFKG